MVRKKTIDKIKEVQIQRYQEQAPKFEEPPIEMTNRQLLERRLKNSTFVVAGGAWQHLWDKERVKKMGFNSVVGNSESELPTQDELRSSIKPELLKRFRNEVTIMPAMTKDDYILATAHIENKLPEVHRSQFKSLATKGVLNAVQQKLGMRYFEEVISQVLTTSSKSL